jgi:L-arabinose isomerase
MPDLKTSAHAWILAGGAHHSAYTSSVPSEVIEIYADMVDVELCTIDKDTTIRGFKRDLKRFN